MVQKAARRGRPPKFDREAVLDGAVRAFFENGFESTTLADLETATGVDRSTLYNSFGGKKGLYDLATTAYLENADRWLFEPLLEGTDDGYGDLLVFLDRLRTGLTSDDAIPGCLIVNDMAAGAAPEAAERYRRQLETGLRTALGRADAADAPAKAALLVSCVLGVNLVAKVATDRAEVVRLVDAMVESVLAWSARP
ncbi:MAG: TetR family transcriptional regulator [Acidimicrobiales bacterium]|nr:MAG: TetR family transcriptional regulator [Acidimicrobiales bacterium]